MSRYEKYDLQRAKPRPYRVHPIWRGIGCIMMVLIPIISYAAADILVESNLDQIDLPRELSYTVVLPVLGTVRYFFAKLLMAVVLTVSLFALLYIFYSILYRMLEPRPFGYGPLDAPPGRYKPRRKRDR